ncbi:MAG: hypothetical protein KF774_04265 [Planctomyces sp.]|nr:hypothetical protein [Planctomyces sp.]
MLLKTGSIEVVEAAPADVEADCARLLAATREHDVPPERMPWLYRDNPDGDAVIWLLRDQDSNESVGFTAALPRRMRVLGEERMCWIGSDFSVLPKYRTLGLALKLRRAAKDGIDAGRAEFLYAHPNDRMAVIHSKVGHSPIGQMIRLARPLRIAPHVAEATSSPRLGAVAGAVVDPLLRFVDRTTWRRRRVALSHVAEPVFDARFDGLFERATAGSSTILGVRDSRYLSWRYGRNPLQQTEAILAEESGRLVGYALLSRNESVHIKDVFPTDDAALAQELLAEAIRVGFRTGAQSVSATLLESHPLAATLQGWGFRRRAETSQMFGYCPADRPWAEALFDKSSWRISVGDRDV